MFIVQLVGLLVLGALLYVGDRVFGVAIKRALWNLTHSPQNQMTKSQERGFIYGRLVRGRLFTISTLVFIQLLVGFFLMQADLTVHLLWSLMGIVLVTIGTYFGPLLDKMFGVADTSLGRIEDVESRIQRGDTTLGAEAGSVARNAAHQVRERMYPGSVSTSTPTSQPSAPPPPPASTEPDPVEAFRRYVDDDNGR